MGITSIPAYAYFSTVNNQINLQIHEDNSIIKYYRDKFGYAYNNLILSSSGLHETDVLAYCNLNIKPETIDQNKNPLFARNYEFYGHRNTDSTISHFVFNCAALSGFGHTFIDINRSVSKIVTLNDFELTQEYGAKCIGDIDQTIGYYYNFSASSSAGYNYIYINAAGSSGSIYINYYIWPEGIFTPDGINIDFPRELSPIRFSITAYTDNDFSYVTSIEVRVSTLVDTALTDLKRCFTRDGVEFSTINSGINEKDTQNPYAYDGNTGMGGGDGKFDLSSDAGTVVPDLPDIDAADLGFVTIYSPTKSQLKDLAAFMWSDAFNLATYKKLFSDPMQSIIGLAIVPVSPSIGGSKNVMFGQIDSGVNMNYCTSQYVKVDCGSVDIDKYVGSFLDYDYTKISIYLPYIGFRALDADDVMGHTISVEYNVDILSGACAAFISVSGRGVMYSYNGSCISNIALTSENFSGAIQNAVSAVISAGGVVAGAATGAAPLTAMGVSGLLNSAANTALNAKPDIQRSGNLGGSAGILSVQHPFVVISRPDVSVPANIQNYVGQCSNITMSLANCSGFTMVDYIHLHDVAATSDEVKEIEALLKEGVIL